MKRAKLILPMAMCFAMVAAPVARAGVSKEEADQLKTSLTPVGAERAGSKDGAIPAWTGGLTKGGSSKRSNLPEDPFASEKPVLTITAQNADQYAQQLSEGAAYLLKNYPGFKIDVYPTHRTFAAPQWVYENTYQNALNAKLVNDNLAAGDIKAGIPFPIPKRGEEVIFNNNFNWRTADFSFAGDSWVVASNGKRSLATSTNVTVTVPYYYTKDRKDPWDGKMYSASLVDITAPAFSAGERALTLSPMNYATDQPQSWSYLTGQRRLRKSPNVQYDVPFPYTSGMTNFDDANGFLGAIDRYDWTLVGKKELIVPYNTNSTYLVEDADKLMGSQFFSPDTLRWERHRVWVVEAKLKAGARHTVPRKRFYVDEDSWWVLLTDQWDAKDKFWKTILNLPVVYPQIPVTQVATNIIYNVQAKSYAVLNAMTQDNAGYKFKATSASDFTTQALERGGVR